MSSQPITPVVYKLDPLAERQRRYAPLFEELRALFSASEAQLITDKEKLIWYSKDYSHHLHVLPAAAVLPASIEEVAAVVKLCVKHKVPMTPRGAGTGVEGGAIPYAGGVVIDTAKLQQMRFDLENSCVWAGAGVHKLQLIAAARERGLLFGPDPASDPCVGGMVSTSGSGMSTLRYGTTRENVLSLRVVTPDGAIIKTRQVVRKASSGLELTQLYIGSEGTLGIICEVCFRLFPLMRHAAGGYAAFETTEDAVRSVVALKQRGVPQTLLRCEMMNRFNVESTNAYSKMHLPLKATILLEFTGEDPQMADIRRDYRRVEKIFRDVGHTTSMRFLKPGKETDDVWQARRSCYFAAQKSRGKPNEHVFGTDVCVPLSELTKIITYTEDIFAEANKKCLICAHISDGNFHLNIPFSTVEERKELQQLEQKMINRAIELGGTVSGEHGIGVGKVHNVTREHGAAHIEVQERIKAVLDRHNLMNPGCFYPHQQTLFPTAHL